MPLLTGEEVVFCWLRDIYLMLLSLETRVSELARLRELTL